MIGQAPAFWSRRNSLMGWALSPIGALVGAVTLKRMAGPSTGVPVPVICIGNPTVGGSGKTPTALMVLARLQEQGARPFALLRGHGGRLAGPVLVDPQTHTAADVGDEALLLAQAAPTVVSRDRPAGAAHAVALGASHVVMDDGFQNPSLAKDVSLLVIDGEAGVGNGRVLPAGPLRAPLAPQLDRADALLVAGGGRCADALGKLARSHGKVVLRGQVRPDPAVIATLEAGTVLAFAGIGRPQKLADTLAAAGVRIGRLQPFPDHHPYQPSDIALLIAEAARERWQLVTTTKDHVRLADRRFADMAGAITALPVTMQLDAPEALDDLLRLSEARAAARS